MEILIEDLGGRWGRGLIRARGGQEWGSRGGRSDLHEVVDGLQVGQVVVGDVDADAEVEAGIAAVDDLEVAELGG